MKDKLLQIRVDEDFLSKLEYLQEINGYKTTAETIRKIVDKEYRKEVEYKVAELEKISESAQELINSLRKYNESLEKFDDNLNPWKKPKN